MSLDLTRYRESWPEDDPHARFKAEVANYTVSDPLPTLENLSRTTGIPVGSLARYILVKWTSSGAEAVLEMPPIVLSQMAGQIERAEAEGTPEARLRAYEALRQIVAWLQAGTDSDTTNPG